jgi:histidine triad (HIT) family protein
MTGLCVFCAIIADTEHAQVVREWPGVLAIRPRHPVTEGHVLVIPAAHVPDVGTSPAVSALTMSAAAELAAGLDSANVITSKGSPATQTVGHLHLHVVPRRPQDGLHLPWAPRPADAGGDR